MCLPLHGYGSDWLRSWWAAACAKHRFSVRGCQGTLTSCNSELCSTKTPCWTSHIWLSCWVEFALWVCNVRKTKISSSVGFQMDSVDKVKSLYADQLETAILPPSKSTYRHLQTSLINTLNLICFLCTIQSVKPLQLWQDMIRSGRVQWLPGVLSSPLLPVSEMQHVN